MYISELKFQNKYKEKFINSNTININSNLHYIKTYCNIP